MRRGDRLRGLSRSGDVDAARFGADPNLKFTGSTHTFSADPAV
jgi:hypothetical protein